MNFRISIAISVVVHLLFLLLVPGFWLVLKNPQWVEVSVVTFPDQVEKTPDWYVGKKAVPEPSAEIPTIRKDKPAVPVKDWETGIPVEKEAPEKPEIIKEDFTPLEKEREKTIPGRIERKGKFEGLGKDEELLISGPIARRTVIRRVYPKYPTWAEEKGIEGDVMLKFWVLSEGNVSRVELVQTSGYPDLDSRAIEALKKYIFSPLGKDEKQEEQWGTITIKYTLRYPKRLPEKPAVF